MFRATNGKITPGMVLRIFADGLRETGFVAWLADRVAGHVMGLPPRTAMIVLLLLFFLSHYLFASITTHATAMLPAMCRSATLAMVESRVCISIASIADAVIRPRCATGLVSDILLSPPFAGGWRTVRQHDPRRS